ncbi:MAG: flagellum-specific ATP synthase [Paracoccaceae bacterium]|jgi:flagellum-specific ATP synthase
MSDPILERISASLAHLQVARPLGRVIGVTGERVQVKGLGAQAALGDRVTFLGHAAGLRAEIVKLDQASVYVLPEGSADGVAVNDKVCLERRRGFAPDASWIGRVIDPDGLPLDGRPLLPGLRQRRVRADPPPPHTRRAMGERLATGLAVFNTLLPLARGQRIGLFAGSGVGKSTLLADLARGVTADVIVIALVGERGRELREFVEDVLGDDGMRRSVVIAATSDRAPQIRKRCALAATAVAEHFRDAGQQVLLLVDSVTRFAQAHRELAVAGGEPATLRGYPASTGPTIAALCERAGPGAGTCGDITAIYSVLVAGSDMEEPVADMLRGVLDGHVVLDRSIAERGRFPAVDLLRSVSRSLPGVANVGENLLIQSARAHLGKYDRSELMIQAGLYVDGSDLATDAAISCYPALDRFLTLRHPNPTASFAALRQALPAVRDDPELPKQ